ncbi:hypothetical protein [Propionicicella superfundia]|uniref:hypothetical protein n=1 Tax=Propionicicella superfundia TaxID=348582 RepID=UPI000404731C|nr:hypothetical protein [Propionicicella superfundia]
MNGLLICLALVALLVLALQPAHERSWRPGYDSVVDRDRARQADELRLLSTFEPPAADMPAGKQRPAEREQPPAAA